MRIYGKGCLRDNRLRSRAVIIEGVLPMTNGNLFTNNLHAPSRYEEAPW